MGTRHLTIVKLNGEVKVAQYGQWDGYPTGQGKTVAKFLQRANLDKFKKNVAKLSWITDTELKNAWTKCGADPNKDTVSMEISNKFEEVYPELSRNTGAGVLKCIQTGKVFKIQNSIDFLHDKSGFSCQYAYEIDLDKKVVRVYTGGREPHISIPFSKFTCKRMEQLEKELYND